METHNLYDLIIIGGGPAGITAGLYAVRERLNALVITKSFGGQIAQKTVPVENWPGNKKITGMDLIKNFEKHLRSYPIDIEKDGVTNVKKLENYFLVKTSGRHYFKTKAVIVCTGADPRLLEIKGEKKFIGKGVSYCVLCDGPLFNNKDVAVIGGGNSAFEAVLFLAKYAKKIYVLEYQEQIPAFKDLQEKAEKTGKVEIITGVVSKEIKGSNLVEQLVYEDRKTKEVKILNVSGIFVEIGNQPATSFVKELVDFSEKDEIKIDLDTCQTKTPGLFACGDVTQVFPKQIVTAAGEGSKAAVSAYQYIQEL
jgi:thioredoxin-disulfide reductase